VVLPKRRSAFLYPRLFLQRAGVYRRVCLSGFKEGPNILKALSFRLHEGYICQSAQMWLQHNILLLEKPRVNVRLIAQHIETGSSYLARLKSLLESSLVDNGAAGCIDQKGAVFHRGELGGRDEVCGLFV
jgi:hypothetical protein